LVDLQRSADVAIRGYVVRSDKPLVGPFIAWVRRNMTTHLREPYLDPIIERQVSFNARLVQTLQHLTDQLAGQFNALSERLDHLAGRTAALDSLITRLSLVETKYAGLRQVLDSLTRRVADLQAQFGSAPETTQHRLQVLNDLTGQQPESWWHQVDHLWRLLVPGAEEPPAVAGLLTVPSSGDRLAVNYHTYSIHVGGDPEVERTLYLPFVQTFQGQTDVLDIGCGKGVFLELLREHSIPAWGIDLDEDMVAVCRAAGLDVIQAEVLSYLASQADASLGGIFCAHLIEHLPRPDLVRFLDLCQAKLRPGSPVVLITPNGASLTIHHATFYKDLTHHQPIHPQALEFLLEATGFERVKIETLSPLPASERLRLVDLALVPPEHRALAEAVNANLRRLNDLIFGDLDCAATAYKPVSDQ
jgi:O-antigen chain-terminating methyltransferase